MTQKHTKTVGHMMVHNGTYTKMYQNRRTYGSTVYIGLILADTGFKSEQLLSAQDPRIKGIPTTPGYTPACCPMGPRTYIVHT